MSALDDIQSAVIAEANTRIVDIINLVLKGPPVDDFHRKLSGRNFGCGCEYCYALHDYVSSKLKLRRYERTISDRYSRSAWDSHLRYLGTNVEVAQVHKNILKRKLYLELFS